MRKLLNLFRKYITKEPDRPYRPHRDPLVLDTLKLQRSATRVEWRARNLYDV